MPEASGCAISHLVCTRCDDNPSVARFDGVAKVVCHCTHVDGPLDPIALDEMAVLPDAWQFAATDGGQSGSEPQHVETVTTPTDNITDSAARAVSLDPDETTIVSAKITDAGELELTLEGPKL